MTAEIKLPVQHALNASLDMLRLRADCTDAIVIIINQRTGDVKAGSLRGDANHMHQILSRVMQSLNKQTSAGRLAAGGLIIPQ